MYIYIYLYLYINSANLFIDIIDDMNMVLWILLRLLYLFLCMKRARWSQWAPTPGSPPALPVHLH